jgi:SAM-dependent methyltransferase
VGDVQSLPFDDGSFDTVLACWMLYHVTDIDQGLSEIARVLEPGGRLIANTNSSKHCAELWDLIDYPQSFRENVFTAETGEATLRRDFAHVIRREVVGYAVVADRDTLVAYRNSVSAPTKPVPENVPLPFVVHSRGVIFVASK